MGLRNGSHGACKTDGRVGLTVTCSKTRGMNGSECGLAGGMTYTGFRDMSGFVGEGRNVVTGDCHISRVRGEFLGKSKTR